MENQDENVPNYDTNTDPLNTSSIPPQQNMNAQPQQPQPMQQIPQSDPGRGLGIASLITALLGLHLVNHRNVYHYYSCSVNT